MAGIEAITEEILQDAQKEADKIIDSAREQAEEIRNAARTDAEKIRQKAASRTEHDLAVYSERLQSQKEMRRRQAVLSAKQKMIGEAIEKAYARLAEQNDADYFSMLEGILQREAEEGQTGEILFGKRDLERLPVDFEEKANRAAVKKNGSLTVSRTPADIENGFVLRYGGIDENCSLRALFEEKRETLQDIVNKILW